MRTKSYGLILIIGLWIAGCASPPHTHPTESAPPPPAPPTSIVGADKPSDVTYGRITGTVIRGVTTQAELLDLFGGPSVTTIDKDGVETWMYDKTSSTVTTTSSQRTGQEDKSEAGIMARYLGIPLVAGAGSVKQRNQTQSTQQTDAGSTVNRSIKTITFIIKFNNDRTVKDYSVRQASY